jgi:GntR family negative regulator for fad regulon and positive regulator of fabA
MGLGSAILLLTGQTSYQFEDNDMDWDAPQKPAELAESRLITAILDGHFPIGDKLPAERELAAQLGVTRPTLREVLQRMARDGWIEIHHGRSTRVRNYWLEGNLGVLGAIARYPQHAPVDFVPNLLMVRQLMAPSYTRQAIERSPAEVLELLRETVAADEDPATLADADWNLHHRLTTLSGNPIFTLILNGFEELYRTMGRHYFNTAEAQIHSHDFYAGLLEFAQAGDLDAAESLTLETMTESLHLWQREFEDKWTGNNDS